jgi:Cytochrome P450
MWLKTPWYRALLLAGQETTASSLSWFFWEMARHPESQECIREELAARYMQSNNGELTVADLDSMTYTQAALKVPLYFLCFLFNNLKVFVGLGIYAFAPHHLEPWQSGEPR